MRVSRLRAQHHDGPGAAAAITSPPPQIERVSLRYHDNVLSKGVEHAQGDAHLHYMAITINRLPDGTAESSSGFP